MSRLKSVAYWSENHNHEEENNNQNNITQIKYQVTVKHLTVHSTKENNNKKKKSQSMSPFSPNIVLIMSGLILANDGLQHLLIITRAVLVDPVP